MTSLTIDMTQYEEYEPTVIPVVETCKKEKKAIAMVAGGVLAAAPISIMIASPVLAIFGVVALMTIGKNIENIK